jgi:hypothetical protein
MKLIKIIFVLTLIILFCHEPLLACICYTPPPPCYNFWKFDAVFVGTVKNVEEQSPENNFIQKVEVEVEQNFKGMKSQKAFTNNYPSSCSWTFHKDNKFLFYGNLGEKEAQFFSTGYCTRTQHFEESLSDFDFFKALESTTPNYWIWGTISRGDKGSAIAGVKAEVSDGGKVMTGFSDKNGDIKIVVAKEGKYKIRVYIPKGAELGISQWEEQRDNVFKGGGKSKKGFYAEYQVEVINNRCGWFDTVLYGLKK